MAETKMKTARVPMIAAVACLALVHATALFAQAPGTPLPTTGAGHFASLGSFLFAALTIFGINFVLSGDNGVVIAMTVTALPRDQKFRALAIASCFAAVLQVIATYFATMFLHLRFLQVAAGLLVLWIAINLFKNNPSNTTAEEIRHSFWKVIWLVVVAELSMSTDNILAVGAIGKGDIRLLSVGLVPSIFLVIFASGSFSFVVEKLRFIIFIGAGILSFVGAKLILTDSFAADLFKPSDTLRLGIQAGVAIAIVAAGYFMQSKPRCVEMMPETGDEVA
jgi:YjbE family integral membrane protein